jgi:hypothetical protein
MQIHWSVPVMTAGAILGTAMYFSVPANASPQPDPAVADHAYAIEAGVCGHLAANPTLAEVDALADAELAMSSLTPRQSGQAFAMAVSDGCPQYIPLLVRWAHAQGSNSGANA